ncbi:ribosomal protein S18 acetylase RimI-like enzyme [Streptosporangium album]|uniref:Ribosomal protein S18 acetylase RimI-like enzyme n=1 Tax=Streptosporangium album TaxID=47479 RepID=A0A7W7W9U7_9ACTN|nr:GNAT family N-acetyltransferase [Streptosporangium album]MBB4938460.1 ribosomal protein S18 acetylase RimI-like enzyme [Streptosporangium album]
MIRYTDAVDTIDADRLKGFFVGWPTPASPEQHLAVLRGSHRAVVAIDEETELVIGFVNMISDGVLTAYVPWLEVLPEYQAQGIGSELMRRILADTEHLYSVDLLCEAPLQPYYERFGMLPVPGMTLLHRSALHG